MKKILALAALLLGSFALPGAAATTDASPTLLLVRVVELRAVGPDNRPYTLYRDETGVLTSLKDLGRVTYQVRAGTLPEGGYHTLTVRLADDATALYGDGRQAPRTLGALGESTERRISGMLWVEGGNVSPQGTRPRQALRRGARGDHDD